MNLNDFYTEKYGNKIVWYDIEKTVPNGSVNMLLSGKPDKIFVKDKDGDILLVYLTTLDGIAWKVEEAEPMGYIEWSHANFVEDGNYDMPIVESAANWYNDGKKHVHQPKNIPQGLVIQGWGHHNCIYIYSLMEGADKTLMENDGFVLSNHTFVGREYAAKVAWAMGQISEPKKTLYSEDLHHKNY